MHDKDSRVCTQRYCACLHFTPLQSRQGALRKQEVHKTAADCVITRSGARVLQANTSISEFTAGE